MLLISTEVLALILCDDVLLETDEVVTYTLAGDATAAGAGGRTRERVSGLASYEAPVVEKAGGRKGLLQVIKPGEHHTITMELTSQLAFFSRQNSKEHVDHIVLVWHAVDVLVDAVSIELSLVLSTNCTCGTLMPGSFHQIKGATREQ